MDLKRFRMDWTNPCFNCSAAFHLKVQENGWYCSYGEIDSSYTYPFWLGLPLASFGAQVLEPLLIEMKRFLWNFSAIVLIACCHKPALAQQSPEGTVNKFIAHYQAGRTDSVYVLFSDRLKNAMTQDDTGSLLGKMLLQLGKVKSHRLEDKANGKVVSYRLQFETALVDMALIMDGHKIDGIRKRQPESGTAPIDKR